jgi:hypothetical protein
MVQERTPPTLKQLAAQAKRYGLPMPPAEAPFGLALYHATSTEARYTPAFLLKRNDDGSVIVLRGSREETLTPENAGLWESEVDPETPLWRELPSEYPFETSTPADYGDRDCYLSALQLATRGESALATQLVELFQLQNAWNRALLRQKLPSPLDKPRVFVATLAYEDLDWQITHQPERWPEIEQRLAELLHDYPQIDEGSGEAAKLLGDLRATLSASEPKRNSVEALVVAWSRQPPRDDATVDENAPDWANDPGLEQILLCGKEAIPELMRLRTDQRLTTRTTHYCGFIGSIVSRVRLGQLADDVLCELAGALVPPSDEHDLGDVWSAWWKKQQSLDEEAFLREAAFNWQNGQVVSVSSSPLFVIGQKYPNRLRSMVDEFIASRPMAELGQACSGHGLIDAIAVAQLPSGTRLELLEKLLWAERHSRFRYAEIIAELDRERALAIVPKILCELPENGEDQARAFVPLAIRLDDRGLWNALLSLTRRSHENERFEVMEGLAYACRGKPACPSAQAFLLALFDDDSLPHITNLERYTFRRDLFPYLTVNDLAAYHLAAMLRWPEKPTKDWTTDDWANLRARLREHLAQQSLPKLD